MNKLKKWFLVKVAERLYMKRHIYRFQPIRGKIESYIISQFIADGIEPRMIDFQFVDGCNYACPFCFRYFDRHEPRFMTDEVFEMALSKVPADYSHHISTYLVDETTLHPKWFEWTLRVAYKFTKAEINLSTNGTIITKAQYDTLISIPNMHIVINTYGRKNIIEKIKNWPKPKDKVFVCYRKEPFSIDNWCGVFSSNFKLPLKQCCMRPFRDFSIGYDGRVHGCGTDTDNSFVFGNIMTQGLWEIWNNPKWVELRKNLLNKKRIGRCAKCDSSGVNIYGDFRRQEI